MARGDGLALAAAAAGGVALAAALASWVRRRLAARALYARVGAHFSRPCTNPLLFTPRNMLNYEMGFYALVERDASAVLGDRAARAFLGACAAAGIPDQMAARQECVAFKKVCLRLYHESSRLCRDLERLSAFFFVDRTDGAEDAPADYRNRSDFRNRDWASDDPSYAELTAHLHKARGATMALHEYRDLIKAARAGARERGDSALRETIGRPPSDEPRRATDRETGDAPPKSRTVLRPRRARCRGTSTASGRTGRGATTSGAGRGSGPSW